MTTSTTAGVAERAALSRALFAPDSIALIGASGDETKYTSLPQRYLRKHGFAGAIFPVNPSRTEIFGERAYASIDRVPQRVDHAFIMLTAKMVPGAVEQCASNGVRCATIFSGGFAEAGDAGRKLQIATVEAAQRSGMRLLGPNCLGVINANDKVALSANEALEASQLVGGRISLLSQSGSLLGSLLSRAQDRGLRLAKMVSVGNEADLSVGELGELLVDDPHTDAILLFLETIRDADRFSAMARRAFAVGKPLIAYLLGRSAVGNQLAASHTGAIAGNSAAIDAFLCDNGVIRVDMIEALIEMPPLVIGRRPPDRRRINVMTTTGGGGALLVDNLGLRGIAPEGPGSAVVERLAQRDIAIADSPLIDLTLSGTNAKTFGAVLRELIGSPGNDAVVAVVGSSSQYRPDRAVIPITELAKGAHKPVAAFLMPAADKSARLLSDASVAVFRTPEACADALRAYFAWRAPQPLPSRSEPNPALLEIARGAGPMDASEAARALEALGIPRAREVVLPLDIASADIAAAVEGLRFPVALKIVSPDIAHKTEAGGVSLGIASAQALAGEIEKMLETVRWRQAQAKLAGFSVQEMHRGLAEVLVGYRLDPQVGPTIAVGVGGVLAEIYHDITVAMAPVTVKAARDMIEKVRGLAPIRGYRNLPRGDVDALARAIAVWSTLAMLPGSNITGAELNPLVVGPEGQGVVAVDALLIRTERKAS